MLILE
ncbi:hypothetical protein D049_1213A, partial [Vibrio parahaemolyticus VPTS-2010]